MKYRCLIFDHDDTVVNSTAVIHWPCFTEYLNDYRPGMTISLEDYFLRNFDPGFIEMCRQDFGLTDRELELEVDYWRRYVETRVPKAYPGIREIMLRQKSEGGLVCVVSHSMKENILRDYRENSLPVPDAVYGWEQPLERRKPSVWPVQEIMRNFGLEQSDIVMIDDLKPGYDMAVSAGIGFAGAGWANDIPQIENFMRKNCTNYFKTVAELDCFLV